MPFSVTQTDFAPFFGLRVRIYNVGLFNYYPTVFQIASIAKNNAVSMSCVCGIIFKWEASFLCTGVKVNAIQW